MFENDYMFNQEQLNRIFPYYMIIDKNLSILSYSGDVFKFINLLSDNFFSNVFVIKSLSYPYENLNSNILLQFVNQPLALQLKSNPRTVIVGKFEYLDNTSQFLFYGNVRPDTINNLIDEKLSFEKKLPELTFYQHIIDEIPSDIIVYNIDRAYLFVNASVERNPEVRKWVIGKKDEDYCMLKNIPMNIALNRKRLFEKVLNTKKIRSWEERIINGEEVVYYLRSLYPVLDENGNVKLIIGYGVNITDRKHIEEQLIINEKRYRELYSYSPALIYTHTLDGKLLSCNPAILNTLGYSEEDLIDTDIQNLLPVYDRKNIKKDYLDKITQDGNSKGVFRVIPKQGNKIVYLYYQNYKVDESDSTSYVIGFSQDITERIKTEKKLRVAKLVTENLAKQKEIFLANMSHEIRTPINGILGLNNLLLKTELDAQQENFVKLSSESINDILIIINAILDIEKIGFGKIEFENNPFNISAKLTRIMQLFQHKAKEKNLEFTFTNNSIYEGLIVNGDQYRLAQILSNLLSNAIKFTEAGSINVSLGIVKEVNEKITFEFSITDTGIGIREEDISKIFRPFEQASLNTTRKYGGTGLGLSICKKLIEMQGGKIKVYSQIGKGTQFVFTLTYEKNLIYIEDKNKSTTNTFSKLVGKKILIGEDVELNQFLIKNLLEAWGCKVKIVNNGLKIIEELTLSSYDIILMDIKMPVMDGLTAAKNIRGMADLNKANVPILAFTASVMQEDIQNYRNVKMNDFILKPYSDEILYEKLIAVLNLSINDSVLIENLDETEDDEVSKESQIKIKLYDLSEIRLISKNDDNMFDKIVNMLISTLSAEAKNIKLAAMEENWEGVSTIAHKIKTSLIHIRVNSLQEIVFKLEKNYDHYNSEKLNSFVDELYNTLDEVVSCLKNDVGSLITQ